MKKDVCSSENDPGMGKSPSWSIAHEIAYATQAGCLEGDVNRQIDAAKAVIENL